MSIDTALQRVATLDRAAANPAALLGSSAALAGGTAAPAATATSSPGSTSESTFALALRSASAGYASPPTNPGAIAVAFGGAYPQAGLGASPVTTPAAGTLSVGAPTVGAPTVGSLATGSLSPVTVLGAQPGSAGARIVAIAEGQVGQAEQPPGSNDSPAITQYRSATAGAVAGAPWCAYFASWAARAAGEPLGAQGQGLGSVSEIWSWAQSSGRATPNGPGVVPKPGDLIVFGGEHVGIVKDVRPDGSIETIEGNYSNQVSLNVRGANEASGYVSMS